MDSTDSIFPPSGSRLLSESPLVAPFTSSSLSSHTGPRGDDLSLSELSLPERHATSQPFTVLSESGNTFEFEEDDGEGEEELEGGDGADDEKHRRLAARAREDKLQNDLFVLRKLNNAFGIYNDALRETESGTERVAAQLEQTNALLDKYVGVLSKSERFTRLIFDERWQGAEADIAIIDEEERVADEKRKHEEEVRLLAAQRERDRKEADERERLAREEKERIDREKRERQPVRSASGVRGVRGTRASMRGAARAAPTSAAGGSRTRGGSGIPAPASRIGRPPSVASARGTTTGAARGVSRRP